MNVPPVAGNTDCIDLLENCLAHTKAGRVNFAAVILCQPPDDMAGVFAGSYEMEMAAREGLKQLDRDLTKAMHDRTVPDPDPSLGADHVTYNVAGAPLSYDFISWLIDAEMSRVREGAPAPLKVAFWTGHDNAGPRQLTVPSVRRMYANVVKPALGLIGAIEELYCGGRYKRQHLMTDIIKASRNGESVPKLKTSKTGALELAKGFAGYVTITLREADYWPSRNSNVEAWIRFAKYLESCGEKVVFLRDTAKANEPLKFGNLHVSTPTFPLASVDLNVRTALYSVAKCNLFVGNGPTHLALFGNRPFLIFAEVYPDGHSYYVATREFLMRHFQIDPDKDDQFPWCRPDQRVVWKPDTFENIKLGWETLKYLRQEAAE